MKAERRHDLKTNTLATGLSHFPEFWKKHGGKVLLALIVLIGGAVLVRYRMGARQEQHDTAVYNLVSAREQLLRLQVAAPKDVEDDVNQRLAIVMEQATDPALKAEALVVKGDLYFELSMLPAIPGASTQPALQKSASNEELSRKAQDAYNQVIEKYNDNRYATSTARFGLAAIAENRQEWEVASTHYSTVANDPTVPNSYRGMAVTRANELKNLMIEPLFGANRAPTTQASDLPTTAPIGPSLVPATKSAN